jgi:hypothetical protein
MSFINVGNLTVLRKMKPGLHVATAFLVTTLIQSCTWFLAPLGDRAANAVFPDLSTPSEMEAPSTFKQYPSSAITQSIIGGRGEGLSCSIPWVGRSLFESRNQTASVSLHFRPSCVMHDFCYRHGYATYGYAQADCDRALQVSAFRMCRQINAFRARQVNAFENCQSEAKKVLLGVSIGGAGSFQARGKSTYFEYDPMPEQANDFVIARAYPLTRAQSLSGELGIVTFYFWRNSVSARILKIDSSDPSRLLDTRSAFVTYPGQYIPTPPTLENVGSGTRSMIALARMNFSDTRLAKVGFSTGLMGDKTTLDLTLCPAPLINTQCVADMNAAINKLGFVEDHPMMISIRHRTSIKADDGSGNRIPTVTLARLDLSKNIKIDDYPLNGRQAITDGYRFLQNDLLFEKNSEGSDTHGWALIRGMSLNVKTRLMSKNTDAEGYEDRLLVIRQPLANDQAYKTQRFMLDAKETDDPLALIRLQPGAGMALIGLNWGGDGVSSGKYAPGPTSSPALSVWRLADASLSSSSDALKSDRANIKLSSMDGFFEHPPIVVNAPGHAAPVIVWTRVIPNKDESKRKVSVEIRLSELAPSGEQNGPLILKSIGSVKCTIDLRKQISSVEASALRASASRNEGRSVESDFSSRAEKNAMDDLLMRWNMSQTIVSTKPSLDSPYDDMSITTIFSGYPAMSIQLVLTNSNGRFHYARILPAAPYILECTETPEQRDDEIHA